MLHLERPHVGPAIHFVWRVKLWDKSTQADRDNSLCEAEAAITEIARQRKDIHAGRYCVLHHYEIGGLLGLWNAASNGGRKLVPKIWGGKFPYQVKVQLVIPKVTDVPKKLLADFGIDPPWDDSTIASMNIWQKI